MNDSFFVRIYAQVDIFVGFLKSMCSQEENMIGSNFVQIIQPEKNQKNINNMRNSNNNKKNQQSKYQFNQKIPSTPNSNRKMSRRPSFDADLSMSARLNYPTKDYSDIYSYKKPPKDFDKYNSQVVDRNASQQTHYTTLNFDFTGIRKLPESVSNIRETFSYNPVSSSRRYDPDQSESQIRQKPSKVSDTLRQTMDIRTVTRKNDPNLTKSVSGYLNEHSYIKSDSQISDQVNGRRPSKYESRKDEIKTYSHINKLYEQRPYSIEQEIRKIREQNTEKRSTKRIDLHEQNHSYIKSFPNLEQQKAKDNFSKKNYVEYYTPKVEKTHYNDGGNVLSPQYNNNSKIKSKDTSFEVPCQSPKKGTDIKSVKSVWENNNNTRSAKKKVSTDQLTIDDFYVGKSLGQGKFGSAHMAFHKASGAIFAIKKVKKQVIKSNKLIDQFILQVKLQSFLTHPFILKVYGLFSDSTYIYLILQFMQQGTLFNYLKKFKKLTQQDTSQKIRYLAESIKYLQDRGIAHRDIKPQNIIMTNDVCKLADFGWATFCDEQRRKTYCGTCDYVAPEILQGEEYDQTVDLWCIGVLAYQLMTGKAPFYHMSMKQTKKKIINVSINYPQEFSEELKSFIAGLIQKDPEQRMSIEEVLRHPLIKSIKLSE